jgi:hypothetical protein
MNLITGITAQPNQQTAVILPDGTRLVIQLLYSTQQMGWFFASLNWNNGQWQEGARRIVNHGNMLRQYKDILDFGIACFTVGNREPTNIQDFYSGTSKLYILTPQEVKDFEIFLQGQKINA